MQLTFKDVEISEKQARVKALAAELDRRLKAVALSLDRQNFAAINDRSYSYISEILNTNCEDSAKPFQVKFIPAEIIEAPEAFKRDVLDFLCDLCGYEHPEKKRDMTPEEELRQLKDQIKQHKLEKVFNI